MAYTGKIATSTLLDGTKAMLGQYPDGIDFTIFNVNQKNNNGGVMAYNLEIPISNSDILRVNISAGKQLFVLGPNGSGKSSLMHHIYKANSASSKRITAHKSDGVRVTLL